MKGFPKSFSTKQDVENSLQLFPKETKAALRSLWADRFVWEKIGEADEGDEIPQGENYMVQENEESEGKKFSIYQKVEDENARIFQLGFTRLEVLGLVEDGE